MNSPDQPQRKSIDPTVDLDSAVSANSPEETTLSLKSADSTAVKAAGVRVRYFGEYELLEEVSRGGMGVVFKARQIKLNRIVALKMILSGALANAEEVERFKTEAEAAANLNHPGIVPIYEIGNHEGQHYFSMAFVEGVSLAQRVKDGPLPPREAAEIVKKLADAVAYAHGKGVIHRDLKPANVLIDARFEPKVTDFGLAKQIKSGRDLTQTGDVIGTPSYMPPEQAHGRIQEVGPRSDVYSLGAILYCLLTGRPPFQSAYPIDILRQVLAKEPVSPQALNMSISKDLNTICLKCLQKDANRRYQTAQQLAEELRRFLKGEPILARPIGKTERAWRWSKRNPAIAGATLIVLTSVAFSLIGLAIAFTREAHQRRRTERALSVVRLQQVARTVAKSPDEARMSLEKIPQEHRDLSWKLLSRSAESFHRQIRVHHPDVGDGQPSIPFERIWLSPHGNVLICADLRTLWLLSPHSPQATRRKILDSRQYSELLKTQLGKVLENDWLPASLHFESDQTFTLRHDDEPDHLLSYSMTENKWSVRRISAASELPPIDFGVGGANVELGDTADVDGHSLRLILSGSLDDGRIVECRAPNEAIKSRKSKRDNGTEHEIFVSSNGLHTICVRSAPSSNANKESMQSFVVPGLSRLNSESRLTICRGKNQVLIHDSKSVIHFDVDKSELRSLNSSIQGSVWRAAVSRDGTRIGFIHHLRRTSDIKRVAITILDERGKTIFAGWFHSSHIQSDTPFDPDKPFQEVKYTSFLTGFDFPNPHFSADASTFVFVEIDNQDEAASVHFLSLGQEGLGPVWRAHSRRIIAAVPIPQFNEVTSVDETGLVRNWKNRTLINEWRIPGVEQEATIVVHRNSLLCLHWEKGPQDPMSRSYPVSGWARRRAVIRGQVLDRNSGKMILDLPTFEFLDEGGVPKTSLELTARELAFFPILSNDGRRVLQITRSDNTFRLNCIDVESNTSLFTREIPEPLRTGFSPDGQQALVLRSNEKRTFTLSVFDVEQGGNPLEFDLSIPEELQKWQSELTSLKKQYFHDRNQTSEFENVWPIAAFVAFRSNRSSANADWDSFFNYSGRFSLADLRGFPLVLNLHDGRYLDFRHRTNAIQLRATDGTILREMLMTAPLKSTWGTVVDRDRTLLTLGPDSIIQLRELPSGEEAGSLQVPFTQVDGLFESRDLGKLLLWGDEGRLIEYDMSRN